MNKLTPHITFPPLETASKDGLLAMGGDLDVRTLVSAYGQGVFPWFNDDQPILWWSPDPRMVVYPKDMRVSRSLRKTIRQKTFTLRCNTNFAGVIEGCASRGNLPTNDLNKDNSADLANETWITQPMRQAYMQLHKAGYAHSMEAWRNGTLVGGLYGVVLGKVFFGESMFSQARDASKVAFHALCQWLVHKDFEVIDCQIENPHLISLGAVNISRKKFSSHLKGINSDQPDRQFSSGFNKFASFELCKSILTT